MPNQMSDMQVDLTTIPMSDIKTAYSQRRTQPPQTKAGTAVATDHLIANSIVVANGKGGVGKTSIAAHLAANAALAGWDVLAVDLDEQGNLASRFGNGTGTDNGRSLATAIWNADPAPIQTVNVRPHVDLIAGGPELRRASNSLVMDRIDKPDAVLNLGKAIRQIAESYDLVVFDTPPATTSVLVEAAFACAGCVVIPTRIDGDSIGGLLATAERFAVARNTHNPALTVLGVALFDVGANDTRLQAEARNELHRHLGGAVPVFATAIRSSRKAPVDMRRDGLLAHEYEAAAATAEPWYNHVGKGTKLVPSYSRSATGLASDYQTLCTEIINTFVENQQ